VERLRWSPAGTWFGVNLSELQGATPAIKQTSTARQVRRYFRVQHLVEGQRFLYSPVVVATPHSHEELMIDDGEFTKEDLVAAAAPGWAALASMESW
jgi:hypothetical protein